MCNNRPTTTNPLSPTYRQHALADFILMTKVFHMSFIKRLLTLKIRKQKRLLAKDGVYVAQGQTTAKHQINDLSMGGLSFYYVDKGSGSRQRFRELSLINRNRICLRDVAFKTVSDIETGEVMLRGKKIRRQGVRFENLNRLQKQRLKAFISNFTD